MNRSPLISDAMFCLIMRIGIAFCAVMMVISVIDSLQAFRAEPAMIACMQKRMNAERLTLRSTVYCVPAYRGTRNDTLTVEGLR